MARTAGQKPGKGRVSTAPGLLRGIKFKRALQRRIELITNMLNILGSHYDYRDIDIQFRRNKPQNVLEIAQIITLLAGELSRETRLQLLPIIENVKEELEKLREERQEDMGGFGGYDALAHALQEAQAAERQEPGPQAGQAKSESGVAI